MSSRVTSLQDYHDCLKSIKAKNVPSIAARMARTLMLLPYRTTERKYEESGVEIDKTGSVFDTLWSESIGSHVPTSSGIMMQDAKRVFELLEKLSSHVIKYERYYKSSFTSIISSQEVKDFLSENFKMRGTGTSQGGVTITKEYYNEVVAIENRCSNLSGLTYVELGYYLNQKTLADPANSREYDIHSFLRDVADMNVYAWSFVVLNRKNYGGYGIQTYSVTSTLSEYINKLMPLVEKAINIILEMEHKIDDIAPILNSDAHAISESSTVENRDPINAANVDRFDPAASGWPHPNSIQPTSWNSAFYIPAKSTYRLSFKLESPYLLESLKINGEEIDPILIAGTGTNSESGATYITDNIPLERGDVVSYLIRVSDSTTTLDTSKVHVYIYDTSTRTGEVGLIESLLDYPLQIDQNTLGIFINEDLEAVTLVLNSNVELASPSNDVVPAKYNGSSIPVDSVDNPMYDQRYLYHYRVNPIGIYEDKSKPVILTFKTKVSPESILSYQVDSSWGDVNAARQVDPDGSIASAEFPSSEGWIDITDAFLNALDSTGWDGTGEFDSVVTRIDASRIQGLDISGCFQIGMLSARPIGQYALLDSQCIIPGGGLESASTEVAFNKASFVVTHPTTQVDIIKSDSIEFDRFERCVFSVSGAVSDTLASATIQKSTLDMSFMRGSRVYIRKERDLTVHLLVAPYKTIWPNNPDDTLLELPSVAEDAKNAIEFKCLDGSIASNLGLPTIDVHNGDTVIFPRRNVSGSSYPKGNVRFRLLKRTLDSEPFWEEVAILYQTEDSSYQGNDNESSSLYQPVTYKSVLKRIDRTSNLVSRDVDAVSLIPTPLCNAKRSTYAGCTDLIEFDDDYKVVIDSVKSGSSIFSSPGQINWARGEFTTSSSINNMRKFTEVYDVSRALKQHLYKVRSREFMTNTRLKIQSIGVRKSKDDWTGKSVGSYRYRYMTYYTVRLPKSGLYYVECLATVSGDSTNSIPWTLSTYKGSTSDYMLAAPQIYFTTDPRAETMEFASKSDWYRMKDALANGYADEVNSNGDTIRYYSATDPSWSEFNKNWLIPHKQRCARVFDFSRSPREEDNGAPITGILIYPATIEYNTDVTHDWYYKWKFILTEMDQE